MVSRHLIASALKSHERLVRVFIIFILSLIATYLTVGEIESYKARLSLDMPKQEEQVAVLVAKTRLKSGTNISRQSVDRKMVPVSMVRSGLIKAEDSELVIGRRTSIPLQPGDFLLAALFEGPEKPEIRDHLRSGYRLIPILTSGVGTSGEFFGADFVDVWDTSLLSGVQDGQELAVLEAGQEFGRAKLLAKRVKVVSIDDRDNKSGLSRHFLEIREDLVPVLLQAQQAGRVRYVLAL